MEICWSYIRKTVLSLIRERALSCRSKAPHLFCCSAARWVIFLSNLSWITTINVRRQSISLFYKRLLKNTWKYGKEISGHIASHLAVARIHGASSKPAFTAVVAHFLSPVMICSINEQRASWSSKSFAIHCLSCSWLGFKLWCIRVVHLLFL